MRLQFLGFCAGGLRISEGSLCAISGYLRLTEKGFCLGNVGFGRASPYLGQDCLGRTSAASA